MHSASGLVCFRSLFSPESGSFDLSAANRRARVGVNPAVLSEDDLLRPAAASLRLRYEFAFLDQRHRCYARVRQLRLHWACLRRRSAAYRPVQACPNCWICGPERRCSVTSTSSQAICCTPTSRSRARVPQSCHRMTSNQRDSAEGAGQEFPLVADEHARASLHGYAAGRAPESAAQFLHDAVATASVGVTIKRSLMGNGSTARLLKPPFRAAFAPDGIARNSPGHIGCRPTARTSDASRSVLRKWCLPLGRTGTQNREPPLWC